LSGKFRTSSFPFFFPFFSKAESRGLRNNCCPPLSQPRRRREDPGLRLIFFQSPPPPSFFLPTCAIRSLSLVKRLEIGLSHLHSFLTTLGGRQSGDLFCCARRSPEGYKMRVSTPLHLFLKADLKRLKIIPPPFQARTESMYPFPSEAERIIMGWENCPASTPSPPFSPSPPL